MAFSGLANWSVGNTGSVDFAGLDTIDLNDAAGDKFAEVQFTWDSTYARVTAVAIVVCAQPRFLIHS